MRRHKWLSRHRTVYITAAFMSTWAHHGAFPTGGVVVAGAVTVRVQDFDRLGVITDLAVLDLHSADAEEIPSSGSTCGAVRLHRGAW